MSVFSDGMLLGANKKKIIPFQTKLYTGTNAVLNIPTDLSLQADGGLLIHKLRNVGSNNLWFDTTRLSNEIIYPSSSSPPANQSISPDYITLGNGQITISPDATAYDINSAGNNYVTWMFKKQPKFFDIVRYTGDGVTTGRTIAHNLGSNPGFIAIKNLDGAGPFFGRFANQGANAYIYLNDTAAEATSTNFIRTMGSGGVVVGQSLNASGTQYVIYLFNGDLFTDAAITTGFYIGNGSTTGPVLNLGWEPQWLLIKRISGTGGWGVFDNTRNTPGLLSPVIYLNSPVVESAIYFVEFSSTGFQLIANNTIVNGASQTYMYMAVRKGYT